MSFHPAVSHWFERTFDSATEVQRQAWSAIESGQHALLAAPTGSGKTLAAFLAAINTLIVEGLERGLENKTRVLYLSPLKALSNDIQKNLQQPLSGIRDELLHLGLPDVDISAFVRTGDTTQSERAKAIRKPPHIFVTTPESVYILLTSESGRKMLSTVETVIVDEIHAIAGSKRGAHLSLSLERLEALTAKPLQRIGLSATQNPIERMANFLIGKRDVDCSIIDTGHSRDRDLDLVLSGSPLDAVMANEVWQEIYDKLEKLIESHNTTLLFVNTRRLAERAAKFLAERLGDEYVTSHHGSLSKEHRHDAEKRLKAGELKCLVATASLELGIDIGDVDLVCQLGSPRSISAFLQRVGRSGHAIGETPKGRLFPLTRDELVECVALLHACRHGELDQIHILAGPLDVLSQQIVAEVAGKDWSTDALFECMTRAWSYRDTTRDQFDGIVTMLADGFSTRRGRRGAHIHLDAVNGNIRGRRGARLMALTNGGAIPDLFDYDVILSPDGFKVGTLHEDFSFESLPGDIFQLGNTSYRILKIELGKVHVADAKGEPPNIPFWIGEAPGRTDELTVEVSNLREKMDHQLEQGMQATIRWLMAEYQIDSNAAEQLTTYLAAARAALGVLPTQKKIVFERFLDETSDMHLVIHSPFGSRMNRAWGLGIRKRFCRKFNFELQAAALEDSIVLSLSSTHSFPLTEVAGYLNSNSVEEIVIQALLDAPMFGTHWRWTATIALAVARNRNGKRTPPWFQRNDAEDLVAVVFPDQLACLENIAGNREIPDHPLIQQTLADCLHDVMDIDALVSTLKLIEDNKIEIIGCDLTAPSVLSSEILNARPYAFLDDAPAEERRTLAVQSRGYANPTDAAELGKLDVEAITKVKQQAWPEPRSADEMHDALMLFGFLTEQEVAIGSLQESVQLDAVKEQAWQYFLDDLIRQNRATVLRLNDNQRLWVAAERLTELQALLPDSQLQTALDLPESLLIEIDFESALREIVRSRLEGLGPVTVTQLAQPLEQKETQVMQALLYLEQEGFVIRGQFDLSVDDTEQWCERRLLGRIHRYTIKRLRSEIEPVSAADLMRFLVRWQGLDDRAEGQDATLNRLQQLEGFAVAAGAWEKDILKSRLDLYSQDWLDSLTVSGRISWMRLKTATGENNRTSAVRNTPIALLERTHLPYWQRLRKQDADAQMSANASRLMSGLESSGAAFFSDLIQRSGLLKTQVEDALGELVNMGLVTSDGFAGLRALTTPASKRSRFAGRGSRMSAVSPFDQAGRWSVLAQHKDDVSDSEVNEFFAWTLLRRYGVVFRKLLERETITMPWRDLLRAFWRMEARGEIRGGRFVQGFAGEQFALPEAITMMREVRRNEPTNTLTVVSACDPLNLIGIILPGDKLTAVANNRLVLKDGIPVAIEKKGEVDYLQDLDEDTLWKLRMDLLSKHQPSKLMRPPRRPF